MRYVIIGVILSLRAFSLRAQEQPKLPVYMVVMLFANLLVKFGRSSSTCNRRSPQRGQFKTARPMDARVASVSDL
jgi:hypothetical protein